MTDSLIIDGQKGARSIRSISDDYIEQSYKELNNLTLLDIIIDKTLEFQKDHSVDGVMDFDSFLAILEETKMEINVQGLEESYKGKNKKGKRKK